MAFVYICSAYIACSQVRTLPFPLSFTIRLRRLDNMPVIVEIRVEMGRGRGVGWGQGEG